MVDNNQIYALQNRMRFNENDTHKAKIKYGFYGETLLNILLEYSQSKKRKKNSKSVGKSFCNR